jgi:hypothetical protein
LFLQRLDGNGVGLWLGFRLRKGEPRDANGLAGNVQREG